MYLLSFQPLSVSGMGRVSELWMAYGIGKIRKQTYQLENNVMTGVVLTRHFHSIAELLHLIED